MRQIIVLLFCLIPLSGCSIGPPLSEDIEFKITNLDYKDFEKSPSNKYAILLRSYLWDRDGYLPDKYVTNDIDQIAKLLCYKGYEVWYTGSLPKLYNTLGKLQQISNADTKTFIAYSGKGDKVGLRLYGKYVLDGFLIIPPGVTVEPNKIIPALASIKGKKAMLINACEAGIFADFANTYRLQGHFLDGVIIASCAIGNLTTPYEMAEMSATFSTFVSYYSDNPDKIIDLYDINMSTVGGWWHNFLHKIYNKVDWLRNRATKPVSYDTVIYRGGSFKL